MGTAKEKSGKVRNMIVISRGYAFLLSGFILFLFFWMFVLGIFVGKGIIPGTMFDIKYPINRIKALIGKEKIEYEKPKEGSLEFYSELEKKKRDAKVENLIPVEPKLPDRAITLSRDTETSKPDTGNEVRGVITPSLPKEEETHQGQDTLQTSAAETQDAPQAASSEDKAPLQAEPSGAQPLEHFSVQVAAIVDREMAEKMAKELVDQGYDAYYYAATINGRKTYRIMCGKFTDRSEALKYHERLKNEQGYNGFISKVETE